MASVATCDSKNVNYALIVSGFDGSLKVVWRPKKEVKEKELEVGNSTATCALEDASSFVGILPEIGLLQDAGPLCSMNVKYLGNSRHVAAGSLVGTVCYTVVNMEDNSVVQSQLVRIDGPISAVSLFSSSENIADVAFVRDHPFQVSRNSENDDERL